MTPFDRSKQKAIIFQGRTTGRETKYANLYYEGTEGWTNVHYYEPQALHHHSQVPLQGARACQQPRHQPLPSRHPQ